MNQHTKTPWRDGFSRWWRPFKFWGLSVGAVAGFPCMLYMTFIGIDHSSLHVPYGAILAAVAGDVIVRQWGKNNGSEN